MDEEEKKTKKGEWLIASLLLVAIPFIFYFIIIGVLNQFETKQSLHVRQLEALILGFGLGFILQLCTFLSGILKDPLHVVTSRVKELFINIPISPKYAFKWYFDDIKRKGIVFWLYFDINIATLIVCVVNFLNFFNEMI